MADRLGFLGYARIPGGGELAYSEVGFVMANGKRIEGEGVIPDRRVPIALAAVWLVRTWRKEKPFLAQAAADPRRKRPGCTRRWYRERRKQAAEDSQRRSAVIGLIGPADRLDVVGRAYVESQ